MFRIINYRTRVMKAEQVFTPRAQAVLWTIGALATLALVAGAAALNRGAGETRAQAIVRQTPGILVPGVVFLFSSGLDLASVEIGATEWPDFARKRQDHLARRW